MKHTKRIFALLILYGAWSALTASASNRSVSYRVRVA